MRLPHRPTTKRCLEMWMRPEPLLTTSYGHFRRHDGANG